MSVVHCKRASYDVYIGRGKCPRTGQQGRWGNPFRIGRDGDRDEVIEKYRRWLSAQIESGRVDLAELASLHGKALGCWCAPEPCHGEVLEAAAFWALGEQARRVRAVPRSWRQSSARSKDLRPGSPRGAGRARQGERAAKGPG